MNQQQNGPQDFKLHTTGGRTPVQELVRGLVIIGLLLLAGGVWWYVGQQSRPPIPATSTPALEVPEPLTSQESAALWDVDTAYEKIQTGMTRSQVETAIEKQPLSCTESETAYVGKSAYCTYGSVLTGSRISVIYSDGAVSSKSKSTY